MAGNFGTIPNNTSIAASQSIRRNAADNGWEAYTPGAGGGGAGAMTVQAALCSSDDAADVTTYAHRVIALASEDCTKMKCWVNTWSVTTSTVELGIYSLAESLLASGTVSVTGTGVWEVTLGSTVSLVAGTEYYLALCNQTASAGLTQFAWATGFNNTVYNRIVAATATLAGTLAAGSGTGRTYALAIY
jgi:hypothetical protein